MEPISARAYAKVNLALEVLGPRPDGYHEVRTVLQTISLWDELTFRPSEELALCCDDPALETPENLVLQAARLLREECQVVAGAQIELRKGIPVAAGLGGGSADAAATLLALDRLWGLGLPQGRLLGLASDLGSDVPFLLVGGTAFAWGRGEEFELLPELPRRWLVLLCSGPSAPGKTAAMYARLGQAHFSDGKTVDILVNGIKAGGHLLEDWMVNGFDAVAHGAFPELKARRRAFVAAGAGRVFVAGTGPTLYALVSDEAQGADLADRLKAQGVDARLVHTVSSL